MILWDSARHYCSRWVYNSLKDDPLDSRVDLDNFCPVGGLAGDKVHDLFEMTETLWTQWKLVKNWFIYFSWVLIFRLFHKTGERLSRPNHIGRETAECQPKRSQQFWQVGSVSCSNHGVLSSAEILARWSCFGEWKRAGIFKTSNPLIRRQKVDAQSDKSFLLFPQVISRYK